MSESYYILKWLMILTLIFNYSIHSRLSPFLKKKKKSTLICIYVNSIVAIIWNCLLLMHKHLLQRRSKILGFEWNWFITIWGVFKLSSACSSEIYLCYVELSHDWWELGVCIAICSSGFVDSIFSLWLKCLKI